MEPVRLDAPLNRLMTSLGAPRTDLYADLIAAWPEVVGVDAAAATSPSRVVNGVLTVGCSEPAWAARLRWSEQQIRESVNERFPALAVRRVTVRVAR